MILLSALIVKNAILYNFVQCALNKNLIFKDFLECTFWKERVLFSFIKCSLNKKLIF